MKISYKDAAYIQKKTKKIKSMAAYNWELQQCEAGGFLLTGKFKTSAKILLFPLVVVLGFFICIVECGLKEFPSEVKMTFSEPMGAREYPDELKESRYQRMKEIYNK